MTAGGRGRRPKGHLTADEQALWEHAAKTMAPLRKAKARVHPNISDEDPEPPTPSKRRVKAEAVQASAKRAPDPVAPAKPRLPAAVPPLAEFDRKSARRLRGGHIEIEARIDLHGLRQDEAHGALRRFLAGAQARGLKWVLVITGKGAPRRASQAFDELAFGRTEPGVLRRNVPRWLMEPDLRAIVVSYTEAAISHGGGGAIYVQLRKRAS